MDTDRRPTALQTILNMFRLSNTPTVPTSDDEMPSDVDEPPDQVPELITQLHKQPPYLKSVIPPPYIRRESLLTRAFHPDVLPTDLSTTIPHSHGISRALSTASSQSVPSTAELTSDCELTSPARSVSPSPPPPALRLTMPSPYKKPGAPVNKVIITPVTKDDKTDVVDVGEAAVEKKLGRKRCIMFACADSSANPTPKDSPIVTPVITEPPSEPQPRKSRLTFVCPTRQDSAVSVTSTANRTQLETRAVKPSSPVPSSPQPKTSGPVPHPAEDTPIHQPVPKKLIPSQAFHEFGSSQDETDAWVNQPSESALPKLTIKDVMKKEIAIRQIGEEAEAEAEEEEREQDELENDFEEEIDVEDDFAPSDDDPSDGGNESDDEGGFADSDDESDAGSDYRFWAPASTTAATSMDNLTHFSSRQRSRSSSLDSTPSQSSAQRRRVFHPRRASKAKAIRMRPGTPELPDSTDFVCGTLDEDRPLEAAYISCREQKKRARRVPIPQDIDPSFPTTDPDEEEDEIDDIDEEESEQESEPVWLRDHFGAMDDDDRGRRRPSAIRLPTSPTSSQQHRPQAVAVKRVHRSPVPHRLRSPAPQRHRSPPPQRLRSPAPQRHRSPPPRRLFGQSPTRMRSPPPAGQYRSPRGSPTNVKMPLGITINRLAQRPLTDQTASLPQTPNPFFRNWRRGSPVTSRIQSGAVTPGADEEVRSDLHIRGPVDIVIGLEKKREKRKEKYWRQHCRKAAKEHSERKTTPGRGVERMKELGLECAERTRGYALGQQAKLVLSL